MGGRGRGINQKQVISRFELKLSGLRNRGGTKSTHKLLLLSFFFFFFFFFFLSVGHNLHFFQMQLFYLDSVF